MRIAFWGSSLVSAYWNGAATYYRGLIKALAQAGYKVTFYEPDAYERQRYRDMEDPAWARVVVYDPADLQQVEAHLAASRADDVLIKASGVGVLDEWLEARVAAATGPALRIFWDVDAPATLDRLLQDKNDALRAALPSFDLVLTYGGGTRVVDAYHAFGARECIPVYNAFDPDTHGRADSDPRFHGHLSFLGNRLPDREARVDEFFFRPAAMKPEKRFVLGGSGWGDKPVPSNVKYVGHVFTHEHNVFNCSAQAVLNISRDSMARYGYSPATRIFEAAGAGACIITDYWEGIETFLIPGKEILVAQDGHDVAELLSRLTSETASVIGLEARARVLREHTYAHRAKFLTKLLEERVALPTAGSGAKA